MVFLNFWKKVNVFYIKSQYYFGKHKRYVRPNRKRPLTRKQYKFRAAFFNRDSGTRNNYKNRVKRFLILKKFVMRMYSLKNYRDLKKLFKKSSGSLSNKNKFFFFLVLLERRLPNFLLKSRLALDANHAFFLIRYGMISVNNAFVKSVNFLVKPGDLVRIMPKYETDRFLPYHLYYLRHLTLWLDDDVQYFHRKTLNDFDVRYLRYRGRQEALLKKALKHKNSKKGKSHYKGKKGVKKKYITFARILKYRRRRDSAARKERKNYFWLKNIALKKRKHAWLNRLILTKTKPGDTPVFLSHPKTLQVDYNSFAAIPLKHNFSNYALNIRFPSPFFYKKKLAESILYFLYNNKKFTL